MSSTKNIPVEEEEVVEFEQDDPVPEALLTIPIEEEEAPITPLEIPIDPQAEEALEQTLQELFEEEENEKELFDYKNITREYLCASLYENYTNEDQLKNCFFAFMYYPNDNPLRDAVKITDNEICKRIVLAAQYEFNINSYILNVALQLLRVAIEEENWSVFQDARERLPLIVWESIGPVFKYVRTKPMLKYFLKNGHTINEKNMEDGRTPIHFLATSGSIETIQSAVKKGADINIEDGRGCTPLNYAVIGRHKDAVECLLKLGASIDELNVDMSFFIYLSTYSGDMAECLLKYGMDPFKKTEEGRTALDFLNGDARAIWVKAMNRWIRAAKGVAKEDKCFPNPAAATQSQSKHHKQTADDMNKKIQATKRVAKEAIWYK